MQESVIFLTEPLFRTRFTQYETVAPLAERLASSFDTTIAAPAIGGDVESALLEKGVHSVSGDVWFPPTRNDRDEVPSFVLSWIRDAMFDTNGRWTRRVLRGGGLRVNYSMTNSGEAHSTGHSEPTSGRQRAGHRPTLQRPAPCCRRAGYPGRRPSRAPAPSDHGGPLEAPCRQHPLRRKRLPSSRLSGRRPASRFPVSDELRGHHRLTVPGLCTRLPGKGDGHPGPFGS